MSSDTVVVTCALTGVLANRDQCPYLPYTPVEIAEEAKRAYEAGAAVVHIHGREDDGSQTWSTDVYRRIKEEVQKRCPIIVNFSTGGFNMGVEGDAEKSARIDYIRKVKPEMAALNMGSMNYAKYSEKRKGFVFDFIFSNPFGDIVMCLEAMREGKVKPELECFDAGHIANAEPLRAMGLLRGKTQYSFILGVLGGIEASAESLAFMSRSIPKGSTWELIGISRVQWRMVGASLALGGNIRVGLEDNFYLDPAGKEMAKGNGPLVEKAVRMARDIGREPATPEQARQILGINEAWA
jgi:uncharacterized protein (DUF849 family)